MIRLISLYNSKNLNPLGVVLKVLSVLSYSKKPRSISVLVYSRIWKYVRYELNIIFVKLMPSPDPVLTRIDAKISSLSRNLMVE